MFRLRQSLLRRPALLMSWVLLALASQAVAVTLDWCLHGDQPHVELASTPSHADAPADDHEHDLDAGPGVMIAAALDATAKTLPLPDFHAVAAFILYLPDSEENAASSAWLASRSPRAEHSPYSRIPGVLAGTSTRLLI